jgi:hypothetical protein
MEQERQREMESFRRLYAVVEKYLPVRPNISPSWLRGKCGEIGVGKNDVDDLVKRAIDIGFLRMKDRNARGITVTRGVEPRKPIAPAPGDPSHALMREVTTS